LPDVPTTKEAGIDITFAKGAGWGVLAPRGTPRPVLDMLTDALQKTVEDKEVQQAFQRANSVASWQTPEVFRDGLLDDQKMYATLLPEIGVQKTQ
jgi:tripartite-type tricarboxylate transporter receptor subunit TctC